jgi:hypothetical protein
MCPDEGDCVKCGDQLFFERCDECNVLMGGKKFHDENECDEYPNRIDGYRYPNEDEGFWYCEECRMFYDEDEDNKPRYSVWIENKDERLMEESYELFEQGRKDALSYFECLVNQELKEPTPDIRCVRFVKYETGIDGDIIQEWVNDDYDEDFVRTG